MNDFIIKIVIYLLCFAITLYGLNAFDFNRFIKKNKTKEAWILYFLIVIIITYLFGQFIMSVTYYFN